MKLIYEGSIGDFDTKSEPQTLAGSSQDDVGDKTVSRTKSPEMGLTGRSQVLNVATRLLRWRDQDLAP